MKPLLLFLALLFFYQQKPAAQDSLNYTKTEIIYGRKDGMALTMIKISPKKNSNGKAIINILSGGYHSGYWADDAIRSSHIYLDEGYTFFGVAHSSQPRYTIPDIIADLKRAVRFIRYNAKVYNIDGNHVGITGSSSGGHLALMIGLSDDRIDSTSKDPVNRVSSRVQAVAEFYGPTDYLNYGQQNAYVLNQWPPLTSSDYNAAFDFKEWNDSIKMYEQLTNPNTRLQIARQISPIYFVSPDDPPVLIIHGDLDKVVPLQQSELIIKKLNEANVPNQLIIVKGGGHSWENMDRNAEEKKFVAWFDKYLK